MTKGIRRLAALLAAGLMTASHAGAVEVESLYRERDTDASWREEDAAVIELEGTTASCGSDAVRLEEGVVTILREGDYLLRGSLQGHVEVTAPEQAKVRLILSGVTIESPEGPAIWEKSADKLIVTLDAGTENTLRDGKSVPGEERETGAALYCEDDLSINGTGSLAAVGTSKHGIQSRSDLRIAGGDISVEAVKDAVRGRNSVLVLDGRLRLRCGGDGIVTTRETREDKGYLVIAGGDIDIVTGGGHETGDPDEEGSHRGIRASVDLTVLGGDIRLDCSEDGLYAAESLTVSGGKISILCGDDGIQSKGRLRLEGGEIEVQTEKDLKGESVQFGDGVTIRYTAD